MSERPILLGVVTQGSLIEGLEMKLDAAQDVEDIKAGKFVVIRGKKSEFFSMITDMRLDATNPEILINPPDEEDELTREVLSGQSTYATVSLRPMLMLQHDEALTGDEAARPVKAIPSHFSPVYDAAETDVGRVFGIESEDGRFFNMGRPLDMETPVCINLDRLVERSNGVFGKTGTGKTFLTRLLLCGMIKNRKAVNFIFDMHSEYGWGARKESRSGVSFAKGLKELFGNRVAVFSLDPESTRMRGSTPDHEVHIGYDQIWVDDVLSLQEELRLNPTSLEAAHLIVNRYGTKGWLKALLDGGEYDIKAFAEGIGAHPESLAALYRKLSRIKSFPFLTESRPSTDVIKTMLDYINNGTHIVLEFGQQTSLLCYLLVANIITRRIHHEYVSRSERYFATRDPADQPKHLVITIEEAHKFLNPFAARQTIFGIIAREMRKYYVSLLIIDQRPSGIDEEVLSQIGTKVIALLNDEKDINAVLTGVSNAAGLKSVLASLDTKQQALVMGHAVPMPVVIRAREYDEQFYRDMGDMSKEERKAKVEEDKATLFGS
ncbi:MAG: ATP-binding protein [candidate division Zixibacteria bacterium]|nr:ATP-binding protein [candidate division Zixibacteria bacterium]